MPTAGPPSDSGAAEGGGLHLRKDAGDGRRRIGRGQGGTVEREKRGVEKWKLHGEGGGERRRRGRCDREETRREEG